jgi:acyl-CoA thioesterase
LSLDADTALEPVGEGRWAGAIHERWWVQRGPFGGYVAAFLMRAMIEAVGDPERLPRTLAVHFVDAPAAGAVEVSATVERAGRSSTAVSLRMEQDGRPLALALGACAVWREGGPESADGRMPAVAGPEESPPIKRRDLMPPFVEHFDIRFAGGGYPGHPSEPGHNAAWMRMKPARPFDHLALTALSDTWMPAAFSKLGRFVIVPTLDLTIHFRAPAPTDAEWLLAAYSSGYSAGGVWEEDGELWTPDGRLVAQSRQLAMIREPR